MESTLFKFIFRYSLKNQLILLAVTALSFPFLYASLDLPKQIINEAIGGQNFPQPLFGHELDQIPFLLLLCGIYLALVLINGGFKYFVNVYRGKVGERMLRRLRYQLFERVLRFPVSRFRKQSQGELVAMITAEAAPVGGFVGDSIALPAFQGGTLVTILVFMFVQDPVLGAAAIALYPFQAYVIPKLQRQVNQLAKQRVVEVRRLSERIGEVVSGVAEMHTHATSRLELADFSQRMRVIYAIRLQIFRRKFFIKFVNNFVDKLTPFFFFSIGGYLVITGRLTFGALVAVLAAYKEISAPWKELLKYYQTKEDARVKYDLLLENFERPDLMAERLQRDEPEPLPALTGEVIASNLNLSEPDEEHTAFASGATFRVALAQRVAIVGHAGSGADHLALLLARIALPHSGTLGVGGFDVGELPEGVTGRRIAYVGPEVRLRSGSLSDNLFYSLKQQPLRAVGYDQEEQARHQEQVAEALDTGNSPDDPNADWIDYAAAGVAGPDELMDRAVAILAQVGLDEEVYQMGLRGFIDPEHSGALPERILVARAALRDRLKDPEIAPLVEPFDRDRYNTNLSVAENLLFGTLKRGRLEISELARDPNVREVLDEAGLIDDFLDIGRKLATIMLDVFTDVPPGSELFEQFSFIHADDLPVFRSLLARTEPGQHAGLAASDRDLLLSLPLQLTPARHRLGLIDERVQGRLLDARRLFAQRVADGRVEVEPFDPDRFDAALSVQDNILFGRLAYGVARGAARVGSLITEVVEKLQLRRPIIEAGLGTEVGIGGARLSAAQRQKLGIARAILKRPDLLVLDHATVAVEKVAQERIMRQLFDEFSGRGLIWVLHSASLAKEFDYTLVLEAGKVVEQGAFAQLNQAGSVLRELTLTD